MTYADAVRLCEEMKGRFDRPFSPLDKHTIEQLYMAVMGKEFRPTSCQQCYHDALIEITLYLRKHKRMKDKCKYRLRAGVIIMCPEFRNGEIYTNDNLTNEVAADYLKRYPSQAELFQALPEEATAEDGEKAEDTAVEEDEDSEGLPTAEDGEKAEDTAVEEDEDSEGLPTAEDGEKAVKGKKNK